MCIGSHYSGISMTRGYVHVFMKYFHDKGLKTNIMANVFQSRGLRQLLCTLTRLDMYVHVQCMYTRVHVHVRMYDVYTCIIRACETLKNV